MKRFEALAPRFLLGGWIALASAIAGCGDAMGPEPDLPASTGLPKSEPPPPASKANSPTGGSSAASDPNPGAR